MPDDLYVPTLNIYEAVLRFRDFGMSMSEIALTAALEQKLYPFGICIKMTQPNGKKRNKFEIYTKLLDEYLTERAMPKESKDVLQTQKQTQRT